MRPTYLDLLTDLDGISGAGNLFTRAQIGIASNGDPIFTYTAGASGKNIALFISGVHGNEEHSYVALVRYMELLQERFDA